ncbi:MAG: hypothetical protein Q9P01_15885 [Anaerolineae bacterium]|nr:hypothetical protein [Anaerolineae bacterium]MDQ7036250.1 hypothetical protein [Anaerolineae bacterium]
MSKSKLFSLSAVLLALFLLAVTSVFAGNRASFDNPRVTTCSVSGITIAGTLRLSDTVYVEEYLNDNLTNTFTGAAGAYSGYVAYYSASSLPYTWRTVLSFKDSSGILLEQYVLEGDCSAVDTGTVTFREVELDEFSLNIG